MWRLSACKAGQPLIPEASLRAKQCTAMTIEPKNKNFQKLAKKVKLAQKVAKSALKKSNSAASLSGRRLRTKGRRLRTRSRSLSQSSRGSSRSTRSLLNTASSSKSLVSSEDCWLYGLVEPQYAARGPPELDNEVPTVVIPFKSYSEFKTIPNPVLPDSALEIGAAGAWKYYLDDADTTSTDYAKNFHPEDAYMHAPGGDIGIVACPHFITNNYLADDGFYTEAGAPGFDPRYPKTSTGTSQRKTTVQSMRMCSGFTCDPRNDTGAAGVYKTSETKAGATCKPYPLEYLSMDCPSFVGEFSDLRQVPRRCVGLKMTVTINTPALTATGSVRAGDNRAHICGQMTIYAPTTQDIPRVTMSDGNKRSNVTLMSDISRPGTGTSQLGAIQSGNTYEVVWAPPGRHAMPWNTSPLRNTAFCQQLGGVSPATPDLFRVVDWWPGYGGAADVDFKMTRGDLIENNPYIYVVLSGFDKVQGISVSVGITAAFEFQQVADSTLAIMYNDFAFAKRFIPEFSEILSIVNASNWFRDGSVASRVLKDRKYPRFIAGAKCAQHLVRENPLRKPNAAMQGVGAAIASDAIVTGRVDQSAVMAAILHGNSSAKSAMAYGR